MSEEPVDPASLPWTGERYIPEIGGDIRLEHVHRYLIARELARGKRVLDIACGEGYGSAILAAVAAQVIGVDIAPDAVAHASSKYSQPNLEFSVGSCEAIPLQQHSVDVVVSFETLEHIGRHEDMMREIRRVLTPEGLLIISSPDRHVYSDALGNRNEFHVRELGRDEFERLLHAYFGRVTLAGQRVRGGSIVAPVDASAETRFVTFPSADGDTAGVQGLDAPVYLLALASDGPLPPFPIGLADGGQILWPSDLGSYYAQVQGQCAVQIAKRLGDVLHLEGLGSDALGAAFSRQADRVSELMTARHAAEERLAAAENGLATTEEKLATARAVANAHATAAQGVERRIHQMASDLAATQQLAAHHQAQIADLHAQIQVYEHSQSWRLTAPLRAARRGLGSARRRGRAFIEGLRQRNRRPIEPTVSVESSPAPGGMSSGTVPSWLYEEPTADYVELHRTSPVETRVKSIAFYLPQFHPIAENDAWWGKGFTEWTNVSRAKPQFAEHYQPHLPGELGFYDLRLVDVQRRQIELARLHGIHGFCYHHYWFGGKRLLRQPLDQLLAHPELDFPFCLCWANENWTRKWDGLDDDVLIGQQHSPEDDLAFIRDIEPALRDPRYIKVGDRPLLIVYRPALLPDAFSTALRWRTYCRESGLGDLFLASTHAFDRLDPRTFGFDAALEFAPNNMAGSAWVSGVTHVNPAFRGVLYDYRELVSLNTERQPPEGYTLFRSVTPMWDNEARRPGRGTVFTHSSPGLYGEWLENVCRWTERHVGDDRQFVFLNAWNEWAEGAHLEPDRRYGYAYLEATAKALERFPAGTPRASIVCVSHDALFYGAQILALNLVKALTTRLNYSADAILCGPGPLTAEFAAAARVHDFSNPELTREARLDIAKALYRDGARTAICNTSVVGDTVELLKLAGFSVVALIHELPGLIRAYGLEASIAQIARHADKVVFAADIVRDKFIALTGLPVERSVVRPQGLFAPNEFFGRREWARQELRSQLGLANDARVVLAVGSADHRKGIDLFVEVGVHVAGQLDDAVFVWVGHKDPAEFEQARMSAEQSGFGHRFVFPGAVRNSDLFFAGADVYLMTSREDPFPNVVVQALDAELPVIGFQNAGGFSELLERGCGVLVPFEDTPAMATALVQILRSPEQAERMTATARDILAREFSFVNYARSLVELVEPAGPRVSVVVPNFNYAKYLPARLKSIISQTSPPHEVLFLDDCSTDGSVEIAREMLHRSGLAYRIITNDANQGTYRQWLRGLREATGDLVWIAEADDDCAPDFLARLIPEFDRPDVVLAYCQSRQIDGEGREIAPDYRAYTADISETKWRAGYVRPGPDEIRDTLVVKNTIPNVSAVLMRRVDVSRIEQRLLGLRNAGDWLLYVHLLAQGDVAYLSDSLNDHRRHSSSVTIGRGGLNLMREIVMVQQHILERYEITPETDRKREAALQTTYEYLGLHRDGPASYRDHEALREVEWALSR